MKILVVDDTPMMLMSISRILNRNDYKVVSSDNAAEALRMLQNDASIDLIITDMIMPNITGIELYQRVQTMERSSNLGPVPTPPMILMTGYPLCRSNGTAVEEFEMLQNCFEAIVQKPIKEEELLTAIRKAEASLNSNIRDLSDFRNLLQQALNDTATIRNPEELEALVAQVHERLDRFRSSLSSCVMS